MCQSNKQAAAVVVYFVTLHNARYSYNLQVQQGIHSVSKNVPPLACYNFDTREQILIFLGKNVTDKVGKQKML